jgi:hypothetical protein
MIGDSADPFGFLCDGRTPAALELVDYRRRGQTAVAPGRYE